MTLALRDLEPGPGWGVLDWSGSPKAPWFVLRRSAKPIALLVTDDGMLVGNARIQALFFRHRVQSSAAATAQSQAADHRGSARDRR